MGESMSVQNMMRLMASKVDEAADSITDDEVDGFIGEILNAPRIFVIGAGRSGLVAKTFAMRLMHLGMSAYVVGETITPAMEKDDLIIAFSGSGATKMVAELCETAKAIGGRIALVSSNGDSRIGKISDSVVVVESHRDQLPDDSADFGIGQITGDIHTSFAPLGTLFETTALVFADCTISAIMDILHCEECDLKSRHANIE
jgi:6-phospho-3-hexuloisomerase